MQTIGIDILNMTLDLSKEELNKKSKLYICLLREFDYSDIKNKNKLKAI
jgi:hypothetical protein